MTLYARNGCKHNGSWMETVLYHATKTDRKSFLSFNRGQKGRSWYEFFFLRIPFIFFCWDSTVICHSYFWKSTLWLEEYLFYPLYLRMAHFLALCCSFTKEFILMNRRSWMNWIFGKVSWKFQRVLINLLIEIN